MIAVAALLAVSALLLRAAPSIVPRVTDNDRAPLIAVLAWQMASWLAILTAALAALLLAAPPLATGIRLPTKLEACLAGLHGLGNSADSPAIQAIAATGLTLAVLRVLGCGARLALTNHRQRARHRAVLGLVGRPDRDLGAVVVEDAAAVVYCLPGRGGRIVFTSSAVRRLTRRQRAAVLAHEQAHLRGRHHLFIFSASLLARAFPRVRLFTLALDHTRRLVEMRADDLASRGHGRRPVAEALLALSGMTAPAPVLAATAITTASRIERLLSQPSRDASRRSAFARPVLRVSAAAATALAVPLAFTGLGHAALCLL